MPDPRTARSNRPLAGLVALLGLLAAPPARAELPPGVPFAVPKDRAEWDARRPTLWKQLGGERDRSAPGRGYVGEVAPAQPIPARPDLLVESVRAAAADPGLPPVDALLIRPAPGGEAARAPLVVLLDDPIPNGTLATALGPDGRPPALVLAAMGFGVLLCDDPDAGRIEPLRAALDAVLARPGVDPDRVAVLGLGKAGLAALNLMARDPRIACGIAAIEARDAAFVGSFESKGYITTTTTIVEELAALCAPRPLNLMVGEALPLPPGRSVGKAIERAAKGTYRAYGKEGEGQLSFTHFGEFAGQAAIPGRLAWMAGLEWLDKHLRPQGPTPLGHAPEPEPALDPADPDVLNLTERGIAGWASEMSARDSTWTWRDGVVACRPGPHEYGWLRCPVEVADFVLTVEWRVPARGNAGIFLRAKPVDWSLPPTEENKLRVSTLGLTWPSRTGLEFQTQDDPGIADRYSSGSLYRHAAPASNPTRSPDRWNRSTVRARGKRVEAWNNGEQVLDADLSRATDILTEPPLKGYIGLQNHGSAAEYRAIRLKRLPPGA